MVYNDIPPPLLSPSLSNFFALPLSLRKSGFLAAGCKGKVSETPKREDGRRNVPRSENGAVSPPTTAGREKGSHSGKARENYQTNLVF